MRYFLFGVMLFGSTAISLAQTKPPGSALSEDQQKKILQVCTQKADLARLLPRDRAKYIADCMDKAKPAE